MRERVHEMMERQVNHMVRLVDDLLEVSRITRGKIELRKERVELAAVVGSAVETSRPLIDAARPHADGRSLPTSRSMLDADPVRLAQVFAQPAEQRGEVHRRTAARSRSRARRRGDDVVVSVRDNGVGIRADDACPRVRAVRRRASRS